MPAKLKKEDIIKRAIEIHGNKYDYSLIGEFKNNRTKVDIICHTHGKFTQTIFSHLQGSGCNECGKEKKSLSHDEYISFVTKMYNGFYDYSKTKYVRQSDKITITCPIHGDFEQKALSHYQNHGCMECGRTSRISKTSTPHDEFLKACYEMHGDLYDYSKTIYKSSRTKIKIICKIHGEFTQVASTHLGGAGCVECGHITRTEHRLVDSSEVLAKFQEIHGSRYQYVLDSKQYYLQDRVNIKCDKHGLFTQKISSHIGGAGCTDCGRDSRIEKASSNLVDFINKASGVHNNKYDYSQSVYKSGRTNIDIICKIHGIFSQKAAAHVAGAGCPECAIDQSKLTTDEFISRSKKIHNCKYTYESSVYTHSKDLVTVYCKEHGNFNILPSSHLNGVGCAKCAKTGYRPEQAGFYYIHEISSRVSDVKYYKLGITKDIEQRLGQYKKNVLQTSKFKAFYSEDGILIQELERYIKKDSGIDVGVLPKSMYESGYTETINASDLPKVLDIIRQFMSQHRVGPYLEIVIL